MCEESCNSNCDDTMEETSIELICDNILLDVFSYLSARELKNASLVCKQWNEIIGSSAVTMRKLKFEITNEMLRYQLKDFGSVRRHQNYFIHIDDTTDWTILAHNLELPRVKSFDIRRSRFCKLIDIDVIIKFLSKLTALENLNLIGINLNVTEDITQFIEMPRLTSTLICGDAFAILECIEANHLQELHLTKFGSSLQDHESYANSLLKFSNLKRLTLKCCMEIFEHINVNEVNFKLNFCELYHINADPFDVSLFADNLNKFFLLQADSLQELRLDFSMYDVWDGQKIVNDFLRILFNNEFKNLTTLDIRNLSIPLDADFYKCLSPNHTIKNLKVHWNFEGEVIGGLLRNCPQLERLRAEYCYLGNDGLNNIALLCKKLIHLDTYKLIGIATNETVFENLKCLDIFKVEGSFNPLISVITRSPLMQRIRIHECTSDEALPIDSIFQHPLMKKLIVQDELYEIKRGKIVKRSLLERH